MAPVHMQVQNHVYNYYIATITALTLHIFSSEVIATGHQATHISDDGGVNSFIAAVVKAVIRII